MKARRFRPAGFFLACALIAGLGLVACSQGWAAGESADGVEVVTVKAVAQKPPEASGLERSGLSVEAAFILRSSHPGFGGLSGLWLSPDGSRLTAVSDQGLLWRASLRHDDRGRLLGVDDGWTVSDLLTRERDPGLGGGGFDAEALAGDGEQGLVVAFEGVHRLRRLSLADLESPPQSLPAPPGLGDPSNSGMEALASLPDGRLLAIAERVGAVGGQGPSAWLIGRDRIDDLIYKPTTGFAPTGASRLDDALYIVERQFSLLGGFRSRVLSAPIDRVVPGASFEGETLAAFRWGDFGENFEAIAARTAPDGRTLIYLLADDNFSLFQRTVLLQLSLKPAPKTRLKPGGLEQDGPVVN